MQFLANNILLDSLQPMARQSAKTVEANIHMLADRMMTVAGDPRMVSAGDADLQDRRQAVLIEAAEIYELHTKIRMLRVVFFRILPLRLRLVSRLRECVCLPATV